MLRRKVLQFTIVAVAAVMLSATAARADSVSVLNFEGSAPGNGHLLQCAGFETSCGPGDFQALVEANEQLIGADIDPIGKFDQGLADGVATPSSANIVLPFSPTGDGSSPFNGAVGTVEIAEVNGVEGLLFTITPAEEMDNAWSIVKIVVKQSTNEGNFVAFGLGSVIADPSTTLLQAFIPASEYGDFNLKNLDLSHWTAFGVRGTPTVPEPSALILMGLGLTIAGVVRRRRGGR